MSGPIARPASMLPFEVVCEGHRAYLYGRYSPDPARRSGVPVRAVCLTERRSGAKRGESARWQGFDPEAAKDLEYLAHAANAYPKLIRYLRGGRSELQALELLRELGEMS